MNVLQAFAVIVLHKIYHDIWSWLNSRHIMRLLNCIWISHLLYKKTHHLSNSPYFYLEFRSISPMKTSKSYCWYGKQSVYVRTPTPIAESLTSKQSSLNWIQMQLLELYQKAQPITQLILLIHTHPINLILPPKWCSVSCKYFWVKKI